MNVIAGRVHHTFICLQKSSKFNNKETTIPRVLYHQKFLLGNRDDTDAREDNSARTLALL